MPHTDSCYHFPLDCSVRPDGTLHIPVSGYIEDDHFCGCRIVKPDHPDYGLWCWIIQKTADKQHVKERIRFHIIGDADLDKIREEYNHEAT